MFGKLFGKIKPGSSEKQKNLSGMWLETEDEIITLGNAQHQGRRDYQEDSFGFSDISPDLAAQKGILAILADGMGGLTNGKAVSETTVLTVLDRFQKRTYQNGESLKSLVEDVNREICSVYCSDGVVKSGSTIVAALINHGMLHWTCVGDSRLYLKRGEMIYQLNEDHDFTNQLLLKVIEKELTFDEVMANPQKDSLVGCIGKSDLDNFDYTKKGFPLQDNDIVVLCSDGVYNSLDKEEFASLITHSSMESCENIIKAVASKKIAYQDNNTVMIMSYKKKG